MAKHTYRVERPMIGDRPYAPGETRELTQAEAANMVRVGALTDLGPAAASEPRDPEPSADGQAKGKAAPKGRNKAEPPVENKAEAEAETKSED